MLKILTSVVLLLLSFIGFGQQLSSEDQKIVDDAKNAQRAFINQHPGIQDLFDTSAGYVIFPNVGKGAYIVGGAAGNGAVFKNKKLIGMASLRQLDVGLQLGGQAYSQVIFFESVEALERFINEEIELSRNISAVALDEGRADSVIFEEGLGIVILPKAGAMIEVSVGGQKFKYEPLQK